MADIILFMIFFLGLHIASKFKIVTKNTKPNDCRLVELGPFLLVLKP